MRRMPSFRISLFARRASADRDLFRCCARAIQQQPGGACSSILPLSPMRETMSRHPWNWGVFFDGGFSAGVSPSSSYLSIGARGGKVLSDPFGPGFLRGQFEYSAEVMPWWQGRTATFQRYNLDRDQQSRTRRSTGPYKTGGAYNGISLTPIVLRWDLTGTRRIMPFVQGAGGLIWTNHKFPPVGPFPLPGHQGTSVWNFTPQFGVGFQYFVKPKALDYLQRERGAHLECLARRRQSRRERDGAVPDRL